MEWVTDLLTVIANEAGCAPDKVTILETDVTQGETYLLCMMPNHVVVPWCVPDVMFSILSGVHTLH